MVCSLRVDVSAPLISSVMRLPSHVPTWRSGTRVAVRQMSGSFRFMASLAEENDHRAHQLMLFGWRVDLMRQHRVKIPRNLQESQVECFIYELVKYKLSSCRQVLIVHHIFKVKSVQ